MEKIQQSPSGNPPKTVKTIQMLTLQALMKELHQTPLKTKKEMILMLNFLLDLQAPMTEVD